MSPKHPKLTLVAAEHSYFSAKARSFLRFKGKQDEFFTEVLSTSDLYRQAILPMVGVNFVPVLLVHDEQNGKILEAIQDTSLIIDYVERTFPDLPTIHPSAPKQRFVSYLIEVWADEWLKLPAMHYRWSYLEENRKYLLWEWGRASVPMLSADEREREMTNSTAKGPTFRTMSKTLPVLGITKATAPEIERSFLELLDSLETHFRLYKYLLGDKPCLGDFALIGPMYAHLFKDPKPSSIIRSKAPAFCDYIERMNGLRPSYDTIKEYDKATNSLRAVGVAPKGTPGRLGAVPSFGDYLLNDEIPSTLIPVLQKIFEEHVPVLISTARELKTYIEGSSVAFDEQIPRTTGFHSFSLGGAVESRAAFPYDVWMLQRCMDSIDQPDIVHRFIRTFSNGDLLLDNWGWINSDVRLRLVKFKLYRDPSIPGRLVQSRL